MEGCGNIQREGVERTIPLDREFINVQAGGTSDFNELENRPSYNGEQMTGDTNIPAVPTAVSELTNDSGYQTGDQVESTVQQAVGAVTDDLADEITAREQADTSLNLAIGDETTARQLADTNLQGQIDAITAGSDVKDIVGTKAELNNYDTSTLGNNDIIKVLQDESENNATTYYRWSTATEQFTLIGEEGPYYTKSQADALLNAKQNTLTAGSNVQITGDTISATNTTYTAGNGLNLTGTEFSADTSVLATQTDLAGKQDTLTAGTNVQIQNNVISATDTTYSDFTGTDGTTAGAAGLVPAPATTDADKFLKADGTWDTAGSAINVVQTVGTSTTDVMSQNATTGMVYENTTTKKGIKIDGQFLSTPFTGGLAIGGRADYSCIAIGYNNNGYGARAIEGGIAIGQNSVAGATGKSDTLAVGGNASATGAGSIAIGRFAKATEQGQMDIGVSNASWASSTGYAGSQYRLLTGLYDPQNAHDAANKEYVDAAIADLEARIAALEGN